MSEDRAEAAERAHARLMRVMDVGQLFPSAPPRELLREYDLPADAWDHLTRRPQRKYLSRRRNIRRAWNRVQVFLPELMGGHALEVLELSTAHGAVLEVLRHFGHRVTGNDYANFVASGEGRALLRAPGETISGRAVDDYGIPLGPDGEAADWPYRPIIESIGIPMKLFDCGRLPWPIADKSVDVVLSLQAIEHYCHPSGWDEIVAEMCRVARRTVVVLLNPLRADLARDADYARAFETARLRLRDWDRDGFRCIGCHIAWGQALGFKLMRLAP